MNIKVKIVIRQSTNQNDIEQGNMVQEIVIKQSEKLYNLIEINKNHSMEVNKQNKTKGQDSKNQNEGEATVTDFPSSLKKNDVLYDQPDILFSNQKQTQNNKKIQIRVVVCCMIVMVVVLSLFNFYKVLVTKLIVGLDLIQVQNHNDKLNVGGFPDPIKILSYESEVNKINGPVYKLCPDSSGIFHTYYNQTDTEMNYINEEYKNIAQNCNISIIGYNDLRHLKTKWNEKFPQQVINLTTIEDTKTKQMLLILLRLYFKAGIYINFQIPYSQIDDRCWKYALMGFDILYADFIEEKNGIYLPDISKFMKVRFPYTHQIKRMIVRLIKRGDMMEECKKEQCLIIKCYES